MSSIAQRFEPVLVAGLAFGFYALTGARDVLWGDPTKLTLAVQGFDLSLAQGAHAGNLLWCWPFSKLPIEPYALRLHLCSAVTSGLALGLVHATLQRNGLEVRAARIAVAAVAVAHTIWFSSAMSESYPLVLLALAATAFLLSAGPRPLAAGLVLGLGTLAHPICFFGLPAVLYLLWRSPAGGRGALRLALGLALGSLVPAGLLVAMGAGGSTADQLDWGEVIREYADPALPVRNLPLLGGYLVYNFIGPSLLLLVVGIRRMGSLERRTLLLFAAGHYAFALFWLTQRTFLIPIPVYLVAAYPIGLGAQAFLREHRGTASFLFAAVVLAPVMAYAAAPTLYAWTALPGMVRNAPFRDEAPYFLQPWKSGETSARDFITDLGLFVPQEAMLVGDFTVLTPLRYARRLEGWRPDLELYSLDFYTVEEVRADVATSLAEGRRVFLLDDEAFYPRAAMAELGQLVPIPQVDSLIEVRVR